ncbi:hypothetical protein C6A85_71155, partial [Mycobacterium sp. ITM-2017-0098]
MLRMATASVVFLAVALIVVMAAHEDSLPTVLPRIAAAVLSVALAGALVWAVRLVPRPLLLEVLRERLMLGVRMAFVALAVILGLLTALVGSTPMTDVTGPLLL